MYSRQTILKIFLIFLSSSVCKGEIRKKPSYSNSLPPPDTSIHKVSFTQRGYIQFLKYMTDVPTITDFTFCIWLRSSNFTFPHPLLSYSKEEHERLIRVWISKQGKEINMAIMEQEIFKVPIKIHENHWHHICPSWNSKRATWNLYINGKLRDSGIAIKVRDVIIPRGGDIVVGQEYTDFDKGLDDGIEGDIFGFNMVLSPTTPPKTPIDFGHRRHIYIPSNLKYPPPHDRPNLTPTHGYLVEEPEEQTESAVPEVLSYFKTFSNRDPKGIMDFGRDMLQNIYGILEPNPRIRVSQGEFAKVGWQRSSFRPISVKRFSNEIEGSQQKPLGLLLVELSYNNCALGKGAPINDEKVLISWTKTPVRVFGGAILKTVQPFCRRFT